MADTPKASYGGINLSSVTSQIKEGQLTWATNAVVRSITGKGVSYTNEPGNIPKHKFPEGYRVIGHRYILEEGFTIYWLVNPKIKGSEIGRDINGNYSTIINSNCLNLDIDAPVLKHAHRNTNCGLEVYWVDARNRARYINLNDLPYKEIEDLNGCSLVKTSEIDCNKLNLQPNFLIPDINVKEGESGGSLISGAYQFAVQYGNALYEPYTSFYSITNPGSVFTNIEASQDFNFPVNKSLEVKISNIDTSGIYDYINLAVIKTINNISSVELIGSYRIEGSTKTVIYTGQSLEQLDINDIFQRYPTYDAPGDLTVAQDILILDDLKGEERISYQNIASKIKLYWQSDRLRGDYSKVENTIDKRGYMRDEVYPLLLAFELDNGHITDGFPMIGRSITSSDKEIIYNKDVINNIDGCSSDQIGQEKWKVYNTANVINSLHPESFDDCYEGAWEYGEFAYWESSDTYDCNIDIWKENAGQPIRHFKFPDCSISPIHDNKGFIYPIGIRIDVREVIQAIRESSLSDSQKSRIKGFRVLRGNRVNNESIIAKGIINNVLKYKTEGNIINATSGNSDSVSTNSADASVHNMLDKAYEFTHKAHKEFNSSRFLSIIGTVTVGNNYEQDRRYNKTENRIEELQNTDNLYSDWGLQKLDELDHLMDDLISHSIDDKKGQAHVIAAQSLIRGLEEIVTSQIEINQLLAENTNTIEVINSDYSKFSFFPNFLFNDVRTNIDGSPMDFFLDNTIIDEDAKKRYSFHSPDTSFYQPELGNVLKLEAIEQGVSTGHLVEVKKHARYQFISKSGYLTAILAGVSIATLSGSYGVGSVNIINGEAGFTAYQAFLDILYKTVPRKNFAYQWNAIGNYSETLSISNNGNKQREIDIAAYMGEGMQNMGDTYSVNNYKRESSVYIRTTEPLPFTHEQGAIKDSSKAAIPSFQTLDMPISSYYASLKRNIVNQYGQIGSFEIIDTGYRKSIGLDGNYEWDLVMGGDVFINRFAYKSKFPFFIDNRVGFPDGADISYNELSNVGRVKYWFSTDTVTTSSVFDSFFSTMTQHFFWPEISELYMNGKIFLFAYGIPYFFCESTVNVDMRQAFNNKEGDFYPHVSSGIPDEWLQEYNVSISQDNTYFYNKSFSKQNKETLYTTIPSDYDFNTCREVFPFRAIFSEPATDNPNPSLRNNWRIFKPASRFDFPQNYGKLISLDGIQNREVLARFENKTLLYNALSTIQTSNNQQAYLGSSLFSRNVPPLDYAETDGGYIGTQNKILLKTPYGQITIDTLRGQIFLLQGREVKDISGDISPFLIEFGDFQINKSFNISVDNHYKGVGWTGVYDNKYNRVILTKLDYSPLVKGINYINGNFVYNNTIIQLTDTRYFCNLSFTLSYSFEIGSWVGFHTYFPNFYVEIPDRFRSGINQSVWEHNTTIKKFNNFYGEIHPYIIEYPYRFLNNDEILQNIQDYSRVFSYDDFREPIEVDDRYFNKLIITAPYQSSGILELTPKPLNNLSSYNKFPVYKHSSKEILYTKTNSFYRINTFWSLLRNKKKPIWIKDCTSLSHYKQLNQENMNYSKLSYQKEPIRGKDIRIRFILDDKDDVQIISEFIISSTAQSYK